MSRWIAVVALLLATAVRCVDFGLQFLIWAFAEVDPHAPRFLGWVLLSDAVALCYTIGALVSALRRRPALCLHRCLIATAAALADLGLALGPVREPMRLVYFVVDGLVTLAALAACLIADRAARATGSAIEAATSQTG